MSTSIFINNILSIGGSKYADTLFDNDYTLVVDINNINSLFNSASYIQNNDIYDISLTINNSSSFVNWELLFNNQSITTMEIGKSNLTFGTLNPTRSEKIGDRFIEIIAHKLFGHGQARSAINNDNAFYNHDNQIWDHLSNIVSANANDIFNQYVLSERYNQDMNNYPDNTSIIPFNFVDLNFEFPLLLKGRINSSLYMNGPNVNGTQIINGQYNIPILIKFTNIQ